MFGDTLDTKLVWSSLQMTAASHDIKYSKFSESIAWHLLHKLPDSIVMSCAAMVLLL
jgi:hypothetical protein